MCILQTVTALHNSSLLRKSCFQEFQKIRFCFKRSRPLSRSQPHKCFIPEESDLKEYKIILFLKKALNPQILADQNDYSMHFTESSD